MTYPLRFLDPDNPYRHGSEAEASEVPGGFQGFSTSLIAAVDHAAAAMCLRPYAESPIELLLGIELVTELKLEHHHEPIPGRWTLIPQWWTRNFRFDFALVLDPRVILIECDGREFHSTPQQRDRDRRKDAEAATYGWPVLRFAGWEIHAELAQCVARVREAIG